MGIKTWSQASKTKTILTLPFDSFYSLIVNATDLELAPDDETLGNATEWFNLAENEIAKSIEHWKIIEEVMKNE